MYIYIFGSVCRGEVDFYSDVDMLAIVESEQHNLNKNQYSIYSLKRIEELWSEGNPFAWHLYSESKLVFSHNQEDVIKILGKPSPYQKGLDDCIKFKNIFMKARDSLSKSDDALIFDFSTIFLSVRNIATCFSLHKGNSCFSRNSALNINENSLIIDMEIYHILERSRLLCTRGIGEILLNHEVEIVQKNLGLIESWMSVLINNIKSEMI